MAAVATLVSLLAPAGEAEADQLATQSVQTYYLPISNKETGQYLSTAGTGNGAKVVQYGFDGGPDQYWQFVKQVDASGEDNDRYWIVNNLDHRCAGISGGGLYDGAPAIMWDCNQDAWSNYWYIRLDWYEDGRPIYRLVNVWSGKCLAIPAGSTTPETQAIQWRCANDPDQQWRLTL
ncbi:RICIN domain-containing protein [Kribbella sp. NPDC003505]|uniref:RICIN domain-containing protein n=1 Tax=Kribbella sp. NPDC003505 TaxID=3154448 RepID=UPI0033B0810F